MSRRDAPLASTALALVLGVVALAVWWRLVGGPEVFHALARVDLPLTLLAFLLLCLSQLVRFLRWHVFLRAVGAVPLTVAFRALWASELLNAVLPLKVGDAGRAVAVSRVPPFTLGSATATIVLDRFSGILARLAVAPLVALLPFTGGRSLLASAALFGSVLAAAALTGVAVRRRPDLLLALTSRAVRILPERLRQPAERTLSSFAASAVSLGLDPSTTVRAFLLSLIALVLQAAAVWSLFRAAGANLPALTAVVGTAFLDLLAVLPAPPAGLGVAEWSVTFVFSWAFGTPAVATAVTALVYHSVWLLLIAGFGGASLGVLAETWSGRVGSAGGESRPRPAKS